MELAGNSRAREDGSVRRAAKRVARCCVVLRRSDPMADGPAMARAPSKLTNKAQDVDSVGEALHVKERYVPHTEALRPLHQLLIEAHESGAFASAGKVQRVGKIHTDRKSTRLNSSHLVISYAVFCL